MEIWKKVTGFENYSVSNKGRVRNDLTNKILKDRICNNYYRVALYKDCKQFNFFIHRLVLTEFVGKSNELVCNHKNGIKTDNRVENLEWVTIKENIHHAIRTGLKSKIARYEKHGMSKLNWDIVNEIRENKEGLNQRRLSEKYNVCNQLISLIVNYRIWKI